MIRRASNITDELEQVIIDCIRTFKDKITWQQVISEVQKKVGEPYTEQGLRKHKKIAEAYRVQKAILVKGKELVGRKNLQFATIQRIEELEIKVKLLEKANNQLLEKFVLWAHNAAINGVTEDKLNEAISVNGGV